jgi:hypothetical protein
MKESTIDQTRAKFRQTADAVLRAFTAIPEKRAALAAIEASAGARALDGAAVSELAAELARGRAELDVLLATCQAAEDRRVEALRQVFKAEAAEFRRQAKEEREVLEAIEKRTSELLAKILQLQDAAVTVERAREVLADSILAPKTGRLKDEIRDLENRAEQAEGRKVTADGIWDVSPVSGLVDIIAGLLGTENSAPSLKEVVEWVAAVERVARQRGLIGTDDACRVRLVWQDGRIDCEQSYQYFPSIAKAASIRQGHPDHFDVGQGTCRAERVSPRTAAA